MLKLILFSALARAILPISTFLDNPIRIFMTNSNHEFLVRNISDNSLMHTSRFAIVKRIYSTFIISKHGNRYVIRSGTSYLCQRGDMGAELCDKEDYWTITPQTVGYKISKKEKKCLEFEADSKVALGPCSIDRDQGFDFKIAEDDEKCEEPDIGNYRISVNPNPQRMKFDVNANKFWVMMKGFMQTWQDRMMATYGKRTTTTTRRQTSVNSRYGGGNPYQHGSGKPEGPADNGIDGIPFGTDPHEGSKLNLQRKIERLHEGDHSDLIVDANKINDPHDSIPESVYVDHEPHTKTPGRVVNLKDLPKAPGTHTKAPADEKLKSAPSLKDSPRIPSPSTHEKPSIEAPVRIMDLKDLEKSTNKKTPVHVIDMKNVRKKPNSALNIAIPKAKSAGYHQPSNHDSSDDFHESSDHVPNLKNLHGPSRLKNTSQLHNTSGQHKPMNLHAYKATEPEQNTSPIKFVRL